ncbi:unnamed protein product [Cylindrotheca closterium]|uniref:Guanylate cyclase domain-containing protein n=1 Tax=Cylindrotheca closterium TaxID=2856 RepID=A0AAD2CZB0_9STRA|nr:unnamed protein product [Cylindrotheca closterium]
MENSAVQSYTEESTDEGSRSATIIAGNKETKALKSIRLVSIFFLFCAIPIAIAIFMYTKNNEREEFESQYIEFANKVLESIGTTLENSFGSLDNLATSVVAAAHAANQTFPNIRVANFGIHAAKTLSLSRAKILVMCPVVKGEEFEAWHNWTLQEGRTWVDETVNVQKSDPNYFGPIVEEYFTRDEIHTRSGATEATGVALPSWQAYPIVPTWPPYNYDYITGLSYTTAHTEMLEKGSIVITAPYLNPDPNDEAAMKSAMSTADWLSERLHPDEEPLEPASDLYFPVFDDLDTFEIDTSKMSPVATFGVTFYWRDMIRDILPESAKGILVVVDNPCSASFTYRLDGRETTLLGRGDQHESKYDDMELTSVITELNSFRIRQTTYSGPQLDDETCPISFRIFPSQATEDEYITNNSWLYSGFTVLLCLTAGLLFVLYDRYQERRQMAFRESAAKNNAVVSALFPAAIREKLYANQQLQREMEKKGGGMKTLGVNNAPIAELYTDTTVLFADIAGFTAWASTREASDVFTLLESIYFEFDMLAKKYRVFKVETVGDSYVAVCGLPEPRRDHAVVMAKFSAECRDKLVILTKELAKSLGPGTESITMRFGLNSGPTTAGVLRGEKSRFQLFGDTTNTAARMESTSSPNCIQASQKTADLLIEAGKSDWISKRKDLIAAKGKGSMVTYWINLGEKKNSAFQPDSAQLTMMSGVTEDRLQHLVDFNAEILEHLLRDLVVYNSTSDGPSNRKMMSREDSKEEMKGYGFDNTSPREDIVEVIPIPKMEPSQKQKKQKTSAGKSLDGKAKDQLHDFVSQLAHYHSNDNPFHNFDHATHVAMSVRKLLARILKPLHQQEGPKSSKGSKSMTSKAAKFDKILRSTYVLTSDPLIQFAVYFSALIHDAKHPGVSNGTLSNEKHEMAIRFDHKSCAEQNSVVVIWDLFLSDRYDALRDAMFGGNMERLRRFRQIVVNSVLATDIFDRELRDVRERRWTKAFPDDDVSALSLSSQEMDSMEGDLRATIVIEYIIQASDVVHTMQHWTVYQKWNKRLFCEMMSAYQAGRADKDPSEGWYGGELWFFDNYIIPLAKKLKECGVFGVSCDEVLDYAQDNRLEWEQKGKMIIAEWQKELERDDESSGQIGTRSTGGDTCEESLSASSNRSN